MEINDQDTLCPKCGRADCSCQSDWANSINDEVAKLPPNNLDETPAQRFFATGEIHQPDFTVQNEGTIYLLRAISIAAQEWVADHIPDDAMRWTDNGIVIEQRYITDILDGIRADGLEVR